MGSTLDFETIASTADLPAMIRAEGIDIRDGKAFCPFHANDRTPAMSVYHRDGRWWFKCHSCRESGDAITWRSERDGIDRLAAARKLAGLPGPEPVRRKARSAGAAAPMAATPAKPSRPPACQDEAWQSAADELIRRAEQALWSSAGRPALDWLRWRGLADHAICRFRLGFLPDSIACDPLATLDEGDGPRPIWAPRGIIFPWLAPGSDFHPGPDDTPRWVGANVRRIMPDVMEDLPKDMEKCRCFRGSRRGHLYPWPEILPTQGPAPAVIVEGEIDALLGWQSAGHVAHFASVGGATQTPHESALASLAPCPWLLIATDHDAAGVKAAGAWCERYPHQARRALLPFGKDIGEFIQAGGDLAAWLAGEFDRLGWRLPGAGIRRPAPAGVPSPE